MYLQKFCLLIYFFEIQNKLKYFVILLKILLIIKFQEKIAKLEQ